MYCSLTLNSVCVCESVREWGHPSCKSLWRHTDNTSKVTRTKHTTDWEWATLAQFSFAYSGVYVYIVCVCALRVSDNHGGRLLKAADETPTGSVTKDAARRAEPGHTRLLLLTLKLCVCMITFSCVCHMSLCIPSSSSSVGVIFSS